MCRSTLLRRFSLRRRNWKVCFTRFICRWMCVFWFQNALNLSTVRVAYPLSPYLGYRLGFGNHSKVMESRWGGSPANIFPVSSNSPCPDPGAPPYVWGTVWRIHSDHLPALDAQEGVRAGIYEPVIVNTIPADGTLGHELTCRCYQVFIMELFHEFIFSENFRI